MTTPTSGKIQCFLRIRQAEDAPVIYRVEDFPCRIGRSDENDITIAEASISTLHAVILKLPDGRLQLEDQWSTNGIYFNQRRVTQILLEGLKGIVLGRVRVDLALDEALLDDPLPAAPSASA